MYLLIVNKDTNLTEEMTEEAAVERFGAERLGLILAGDDDVYEGDDITEEMDPYYEDMDGDHESALASAGFGTDEDYGYYGDDFF